MTDSVTVFVDDAVLGRLPPLCVTDGVYTEDRITQRLEIGSEGLGIAWLLVFVGPIGWIALVAISLARSGAEVLQVDLPVSEDAYRREVAARSSYRAAVALAAIGAAGGFVALVMPWNGSPALGLLLAAATISALVAGVIGTVIANRRLQEASVDVSLDASRRWVTIRRVHPNFAAEARRQALNWEKRSESPQPVEQGAGQPL